MTNEPPHKIVILPTIPCRVCGGTRQDPVAWTWFRQYEFCAVCRGTGVQRYEVLADEETTTPPPEPLEPPAS